jgi:hypothetical protein
VMTSATSTTIYFCQTLDTWTQSQAPKPGFN